ncbi:MAG: aldo/keto reductase [Clostridia bacterium]|nr:aldo/keto reductase [Clostridia bacterium]
MNYKEFGKTGKKVSVIGFGGMRFPTAGKEGEYDYDYCSEMIHEANRLGINYFDTAPFYNNDQSEDIFGNAIRNMPGDFFISTKCSSSDAYEMRKSLERSLRRLNVEKINFFHIWCVMDLDDYNRRMASGGAYDELVRAKSEGLVEHICISTHCTGDEISHIASEQKFDGITLGYNILNYKFRQLGIKAAHANHTAVVTMNPLGGGLLTSNSSRFNYIMDKGDDSIFESALKFNASHEEITVVLTGMDSIEHVRSNATNCAVIPGYAEKTKSRLLAYSNPEFDSLCTGCRYCEPCPYGVPVSKFMLAFNRKTLGDDNIMKNNIKMHWRINPELVHKCTECGACEKRCTQHLPIIERLKIIGTVYD